MSRGLSKQQLRILQQLRNHPDGTTIDHLTWPYQHEKFDPLDEAQAHAVLVRAKRAVASLKNHGLVTTRIVRDDPDRPRRWMRGPSGFCTRIRTHVRLTDAGTAIAPEP